MKRTGRQIPEYELSVEHFLTASWIVTRDHIEQEFLSRSQPLLLMLSQGNKPNVGELAVVIDKIVADAVGRRCHDAMLNPRSSAYSRSLWQAANEVCPIPVKFAHELISDAGFWDHPKKSRGSLIRVALRSHLYRRKLEALKGHSDGSSGEHGARIWSKLNDIDRDLEQDYFRRHGTLPAIGSRCTTDHARNIKFEIQRRFQNDRRLATLSIAKIEEYFVSHCPECEQPFQYVLPDSDAGEEAVVEAVQNDSGWRDRDGTPLQELTAMLRPALERCLRKLPELQIAVLFREGLIAGSPLNTEEASLSRDQRISVFCSERKMSRADYDRLLDASLSCLQTCLAREWTDD